MLNKAEIRVILGFGMSWTLHMLAGRELRLHEKPECLAHVCSHVASIRLLHGRSSSGLPGLLILCLFQVRNLYSGIKLQVSQRPVDIFAYGAQQAQMLWLMQKRCLCINQWLGP
ncbi:hypothetical protein ABBQ32_008524 [Trebouxia sp. C0010 RCD-2024]